jgi:SHS2 domain-containing protein
VKNYELIEHTADIGIRVIGENLEELFSNTALAMFDIIAEEKSPGYPVTKSPVKNSIKLKADSPDELFINWLNELLSLSAIKELIFSEFKIKKIQGNSLEAEAFGRNIKEYQVNSEIKAATYHELKIAETADGWQAEVIFDV